MGDRICIKITNGEETTPLFYGHWCGARGLKVMIETLNEPANSLGGYMCNFITKVMGGEPHPYSYDIWNDGDGEYAADGDWGLWIYHTMTQTWTTTYPPLKERSMTNKEVTDYIKSRNPCLYRTCECEFYGSDKCSKYFYDKHIAPVEARLKEKQ